MEEMLNNLKNAIKNYSDKLIANAGFDRTISSMINSVSGSTYTIFIKKQEYIVPNNTGLTLAVGDNVWVTIPCNDFKKMYISAKKN